MKTAWVWICVFSEMNESGRLEKCRSDSRTEDGAPKGMSEAELREWHSCLRRVAHLALDEFVPEFWKERLKYFSDFAGGDAPMEKDQNIGALAREPALPILDDLAAIKRSVHSDQRPADLQVVAERAARRQAVVIPILANKRWAAGRLATEAGVGKNSVYEYLDGKRVTISDRNRQAIAEVLGLDPEQLPR